MTGLIKRYTALLCAVLIAVSMSGCQNIQGPGTGSTSDAGGSAQTAVEAYLAAAEEKGIGPLHLSITHEGGMAAAVCIAEKDG